MIFVEMPLQWRLIFDAVLFNVGCWFAIGWLRFSWSAKAVRLIRVLFDPLSGIVEIVWCSFDWWFLMLCCSIRFRFVRKMIVDSLMYQSSEIDSLCKGCFVFSSTSLNGIVEIVWSLMFSCFVWSVSWLRYYVHFPDQMIFPAQWGDISPPRHTRKKH